MVARPAMLFVQTLIKSHGTSRIALALALIHVLVYLAVLSTESPLPPPAEDPEPCPPGFGCLDLWDSFGIILAGREFHHNVPFGILSYVDMPGWLLGAVVASPLDLINMPEYEGSYVAAAVFLLLGTVQWWCVGMLVSRRRAGK
jgi:hypothetical protein